MTVEELKIKKRNLEFEIHRMLSEFQNDTKTEVVSVGVERVISEFKQGFINKVIIEVKL